MRRVTKRFGFREVGDEEEWNLYWTDYSVTLDRVMDMKKYQVYFHSFGFKLFFSHYFKLGLHVMIISLMHFVQKINHFPGMSEICRKDLLARNLNRMMKLFPKDYNCFPRSWCLPAECVFPPSHLFTVFHIVCSSCL